VPPVQVAVTVFGDVELFADVTLTRVVVTGPVAPVAPVAPVDPAPVAPAAPVAPVAP
jgi:hypothetical protein